MLLGLHYPYSLGTAAQRLHKAYIKGLATTCSQARKTSPQSFNCSNRIPFSLPLAASASAANWPDGNSSTGCQGPPDPPLGGGPWHPLATALAAILLAARAAASSTTDAFRATGRRASRLQVWLGKPEAVLFREGCQLLACLMFILLYVWSTYSPVVPGGGRWWLDLLLSLLFAADYIHRTMTSSRQPLLAVLHPLAIIDLLSFAPSLLGALLPEYMAPYGCDLRWFRAFRALRLLRLSLLSGNLSTMKTNRGVLIAGNLNVPLVWLVASVVAWMFTSASCVAVMEKLPWHDALYFVGSTLTTVGYGDVVVKSSMGRLFVLVMMLVGVVLIPVRASQLYSRLSERLMMSGHRPGDAPGCAGGYVVLSGRLSDVRGFNDFLQDFLVQVRSLSTWRTNPAGGRQGLQLVCLCNKPSVEFLALQELHESHLTLVEGSAFNERDLLHRAGLPASLGAMVLADRFSSNAAAEDTDVQFRVWAIKSAVKRLPLCVQVLRRSSVDVISNFLDPYLDVIMSVEGTRMRLLALSCLVPGASTLVANLLRSSGPNAGFSGGPRHTCSSNTGRFSWASSSGSGSSSSGGSPSASVDSQDEGPFVFGWHKLQAAVRSLDDVMLGYEFQRAGSNGKSRHAAAGKHSDTSGGVGRADMLAGRRWLREYADGAHCELFFVPAGPPLAGLRFTDAAQALYEATGAMLVGLFEVGSQRLLLNASSHTLHQEQQLVLLAANHTIAQAAAGGFGVEAVLYSQALRSAQVEAAAAAAAVAAAHEAEAQQLQQPQASAAGQQHWQQQVLKQSHMQQSQEEEDRSMQPPQQGFQQAHPQQQQQEQGQLPVLEGWPPSVAAKPTAINAAMDNSQPGSSRVASKARGSVSNADGSRSVTVRVPESLAAELMAQPPTQPGASTASSTTSSSSSHVQQLRQCVEQQPLVHNQLQQQPGQQQHSAAAGAAFAAGGYYADAYAAFEQQMKQQQLELGIEGPPAAVVSTGRVNADAAWGPDLFDVDDSSDLVSGCLAPWSGAFESDSLDETELCTDSEMLEAALLQRQKQQVHAEKLQQQQQQQWLMLSSYDSASMHKQPSNPPGPQAPYGSHLSAPNSSAGSPGSRPGSRRGSPSAIPADTAVLPAAGSAVSVTSATAAALDQHLQQQQQPITGQVSSEPLQQQHQPQREMLSQQPSTTSPSHLQGHVIVAGCASSFVQFARQLAASASPTLEPLTVVLLHPEYPGPAVEAIRKMGVAVHHVPGRSSDAAALVAAGAKRARSLVFVGPSERPTHLPATAVSGVYGDPTSTREASHADLSGSSRTAVLADADALSSCYGVGEVFLPDSLSTIVELGFTSSIRFLQPGLLLHGRPAPHSSGSLDEGPGFDLPGSQLLGKLRSGWSQGWAKLWQHSHSEPSKAGERPGSNSSSIDGAAKAAGDTNTKPVKQWQDPAAKQQYEGFLPTGSPISTRPPSPLQQQQQHQLAPHDQHIAGAKQQQQQQQQPLSWPWKQQLHKQHHSTKVPRSSWRHRKEIEEAGQLEGLSEWQLNSYYAAGRVMVPALLDIFTCQGFFKRQALLDLLTELAGDDGRPGGAMLQQQAVPPHLVGCCYHELVQHYLTNPDPQSRHIPLGLLRRKAENRAWRLPYVATHPHPDTLLQATDMVFVLRPQ